MRRGHEQTIHCAEFGCGEKMWFKLGTHREMDQNARFFRGWRCRRHANPTPTIDAQCDGGRTPCDPPRPRVSECWWFVERENPERWMPGVRYIEVETTWEHWARLLFAGAHRGPTCTASEAT